MKNLLMVIALTGFIGSAHANKLADLAEFDHPKCRGLNITEEQKVEIKAVATEAFSEIKKLMPAIKAGKKVLRTVMTNPSTTKEEAKSARKEFRLLKKSAKKLKKQAKAKINFDILSGEQRVKLLKCSKKGQRRGRHGRKPGRGHGRRGHGHRGGHSVI